MILNLLLIITINVFIADGIILNESLLNQLGFNKNSSNINIDNENIDEIDTNAFKDYTNITMVKLTLFKLSTIDLKVFKNSSAKLISIWVSSPSLMTLANSEKTKFPILQKLELNVNSLLGLDSDVINGLPNLTLLSVTNSIVLYRLQPKQLSSLKNLEVLRLTVYNQTSLSKAHFNGLTSLKRFAFQSSNIQMIDNDTFSGLTNLTSLSISFLLSPLQLNQFSSLKYLEILKLTVKNQTSLSKAHFNGLTSLRTLDFQSSNIQMIDNDTFNGLTNLTMLTISFHLSSLKTNQLSSLNNLEVLSLTLENQTRLSKAHFNGLTSLSTLEFHSSYIQMIDNDTFKGLTSLKTLEFQSSNIEKIENDTFNGLTNLTSLSLSNSFLLSPLKHNQFSLLYKLKILKLKVKNQTRLSKAHFNGLTSLKKLDFQSSNIQMIDNDTFNGLTNLTMLTISFHLSPLKPNQFSSLKNLEVLHLKVKNQTSLSKAHFNGLISLRLLDFQSNNIQMIDNDTFNDLTNLKNLNLRNNLLNQLDLSNTSGKLHSLILGQNNLSYLRIPKRLDNLLELDLSNNRFRSFRSIDFYAFPNLRTLRLSDNPHENPNEISTYLKPLVNLSDAIFSNMLISGTLDSSLFKFNSKIIFIDLSNNRIEKIGSNAFANLNLTRIILSNNLLTELDNSVFLGQNKLFNIDLDNNQLSNIGARTFNNLTTLETIYLSYNKLSKLDNSTFSGCTNLRGVYLFNNADLQTSNLKSLCPTATTNCNVYY